MRHSRWSVSLSTLAVAFGLAGTAQAAVYYVDADSPNDGPGNDWEHAFHYLQNALAVASGIDRIRVAQGTYRPDEDSANPGGTGDRSATFEPPSGVKIYGGYAGWGEPNPGERNIDAYVTILSGDLAENDGPGPFENYEGTVDEVLPEKGRVRVLVTIFGRQAPIDLEYWQIAKVTE